MLVVNSEILVFRTRFTHFSLIEKNEYGRIGGLIFESAVASVAETVDARFRKLKIVAHKGVADGAQIISFAHERKDQVIIAHPFEKQPFLLVSTGDK